MREITRALLVATKEWVADGKLPPASRYPKLSDGTLLAAKDVVAAFPNIPGVPCPRNIQNPFVIYDLGPDFRYNDLSGKAAHMPPPIIGEVRSVLPKVDADGNESGGIHTVLQQAPLGTYLGWNVTAAGFMKGIFCSLAGGYVPFAATRHSREESHDPRPSLSERYRTHEAYVRHVRRSAAALVKQRFLLEDDAEKMVRDAEQSDLLR